MAGTRSSARQAEKANSTSASSPPSSASSARGTKRKADDPTSSPSAAKAKRGRPAKEQKTIEETLPADDDLDLDGKVDEGESHEKEGNETNGHARDHEKHTNDDDKGSEDGKSKAENGHANEDDMKIDEAGEADKSNAFDKVKGDENDAGKTSKKESKPEKTDDSAEDDVEADAIEEDKHREAALPSNVLEKGIIYFFTRGRVGVDDADSVQDLARSYAVMRPLPDGAKITDGAIPDLKNNRLIALPKKVWPRSGKDRFMAFVEKAQTSNQTLKEEFYSGSDYTTKTVGTRHTPEVTPLGEGVYAMTTTGGGQGTTHLVYMLSIPEEIGEVQKDVGLASKGSFVVSLKNPESSGPSYAQLPEKPNYPKEFQEEFRGRGWMPAHPKHLDYANAQMLLIGEDFETSSNLEPAPKDERDDVKETPQEELEKLREEDEHRVENLEGDDTIFADLGLSSKEYPKVKTTW